MGGGQGWEQDRVGRGTRLGEGQDWEGDMFGQYYNHKLSFIIILIQNETVLLICFVCDMSWSNKYICFYDPCNFNN